ncbi:monosaccharide ABC transporter ATP-binding protein (CUT2 family) [Halopolyspora algeriensis]|uniref:Monosaccharide ABC transporter ATP-binding protein (CUT2 family) n=2 Tax=Halopolyspora algeriensis TaxID=1500506 RepID=A0A368W1B3_9ACTN|nr:monosaccharide ABC transporter ATP-binding protein (CUT2 family) [Halopolyspora algeriensis]TQM54172.1 monosaccharide ABC transporter ATP-binding protein (CUT2 family) [Halopolyspora algeriensis]
MTTPLLEMRDIVKTFPGVRALDGVDLDVRPGEVHCLLGQNGAGKSTLIKILSGAHRTDEGTITWQGTPVSLRSPSAAMKLGIATIYQELDLVDGLSIAENIHLGHERSRLGFSRRAEMLQAARKVLDRLGHGDLDPAREVGELPSALKQIVSMARALSHDARLIIMDEPSAVLAHDEIRGLFEVIGQLTEQGIAVVYISHRLEEIREIGDRVTVLKDGRTVAGGLPAEETPTQQVVSLMTGRDVEYAFPQRPQVGAREHSPELLRAEHLSRPREFDDISFTVRRGEIVGLAGLVGSGRSEILQTLYGARTPATGRILVDGEHLRPGSVRAAVRAGMGLAPEERKSQALVQYESIARNVSLASLGRYSRLGWVDRGREHAAASAATDSLQLQPADTRRPVRVLSGGNQQKAVVARWLLADCRLLLLDEPTRGVDVGARAEIYALVRRLADSGVGVVLVSSEIPEVLGLADRVLVLREGRIVREADARDIDEPQVLDLFMEGSAA